MNKAKENVGSYWPEVWYERLLPHGDQNGEIFLGCPSHQLTCTSRYKGENFLRRRSPAPRLKMRVYQETLKYREQSGWMGVGEGGEWGEGGGDWVLGVEEGACSDGHWALVWKPNQP